MAPPSPASPIVNRLGPLLAALLLALFWGQAVSASRHWSQTSDELPHLTAGYVYDRFGDYRMHFENGNLPQRVQGLAPLALGARFPMDEARWRVSDYWQLGWDFLYGRDNPTDRMLLGARALNALFGVGLGAFIFVVARRWHGDAGGLVALGFYVFYPDFLAHSALATSDVAGALGLTLATWCFWQHLARRDFRSGAVAGLCSGLALVAKFNGLLIAPVYALLVAIDSALCADRGRRLARFGRNLGLVAAQAAAALLVVWAFYSFRYAARAPDLPPVDRFAWSWDQMIQLAGAKGSVLVFAADWHLLPQAWLYGLANVLAGEAARPSFFAGEYSLHGWWQFFPTLFLVKAPVGMLAALLLALAAGWFRLRAAARGAARAAFLRSAPLVVLAVVVALSALTSHLNIGHRHILALYPPLFIALGGLAAIGRRWQHATLALLLASAVESAAARPDYLAFFNVAAGGPDRAYRLVVDSSLDWGQALPALHTWLDRHRQGDEPVYLSYFGSAWPPHYGVNPTHFLPGVNIAVPPFHPYAYEPGLYCLSATSLAEVYSDYRGPWRAAWERAWRDPATPPGERELLRFSRLCKYLQGRQPDGNAGHAILIFRLDAAAIQAALDGPVKGW
ncbi:MAG TPA: glycosyltransferase family 39 protein [Lacunisphaera sp.]|nr:glycosyltransferase family 39 protein [Lacunisphaera sp.]